MAEQIEQQQAQQRDPLKVLRVEHIGVALKDIEGARPALEALGLNVTFEEQWPEFSAKMAWYPAGETALELLQGPSDAPFVGEWLGSGAGFFHVCFEVQDIDAACEELRRRGVGLIGDHPHDGHAGRRVMFIDPASTEGLLFEIAEDPARREREEVR